MLQQKVGSHKVISMVGDNIPQCQEHSPVNNELKPVLNRKPINIYCDSVDPDKMLQNAASYHGLHCLLNMHNHRQKKHNLNTLKWYLYTCMSWKVCNWMDDSIYLNRVKMHSVIQPEA